MGTPGAEIQENSMIKTLAAAAVLSLALVPSANAWNDIFNSVFGPKGNDTGGIIPWSPENERDAFQIASDQCGRWNKFAVATSIHRAPGDFIGYKCVWDQPTPVAVRHRHHRHVDVVIEK
jgi:hypothetical protein